MLLDTFIIWQSSCSQNACIVYTTPNTQVLEHELLGHVKHIINFLIFKQPIIIRFDILMMIDVIFPCNSFKNETGNTSIIYFPLKLVFIKSVIFVTMNYYRDSSAWPSLIFNVYKSWNDNHKVLNKSSCDKHLGLALHPLFGVGLMESNFHSNKSYKLKYRYPLINQTICLRFTFLITGFAKLAHGKN